MELINNSLLIKKSIDRFTFTQIYLYSLFLFYFNLYVFYLVSDLITLVAPASSSTIEYIFVTLPTCNLSVKL